MGVRHLDIFSLLSSHVFVFWLWVTFYRPMASLQEYAWSAQSTTVLLHELYMSSLLTLFS